MKKVLVILLSTVFVMTSCKDIKITDVVDGVDVVDNGNSNGNDSGNSGDSNTDQGNSDSSDDSDTQNFKNTAHEKELMKLINDYRASKGKKRLEILPALKQYTDAHTNYQIKKGKISHDNYKERGIEVLKKFSGVAFGENVAFSSERNAWIVFNGWKNSPDHNKNMLGNFTHFNLTAKKGKNVWYYTNIFIKK